MKLSFKKEPRETGLSGVGNPWPATNIKADKKKCGWIQPPNWQNEGWWIWFSVKDNEKHCGWKNIKLNAKFENEPGAREFIKTNWNKIQEKWALHCFND